MKLPIPIVALSLVAILCRTLGAAPNEKVVVVSGPTVVAFFPPVTQAELSKDADTNEALADFQYYAGRLREQLRHAGVDFEEVYASSLLIECGAKTTRFRPEKVEVGYYLIAPGKSPRVEYGVMTDEDILQVAYEYFGPTAVAKRIDQNEQKVWWWFDDCPDGRTVGIDVLLDRKPIYHAQLRICQMYRKDADSKPTQKRRMFNLSGGHTFQNTYHTKETEEIEGNIWQAGADPDDLLLGLSFSTKDQVLLNTIHILNPSKASKTNIDTGMVVKTYPVGSTEAQPAKN